MVVGRTLGMDATDVDRTRKWSERGQVVQSDSREMDHQRWPTATLRHMGWTRLSLPMSRQVNPL